MPMLRCRDSMRHQGVAGSPPPAVLIPQDVRNVVREPASHALGQRGLSARSAAADTPPAGMLAAGWPAAATASSQRSLYDDAIHSFLSNCYYNDSQLRYSRSL